MLQLCKAHPFCKYGDDCRYAHSELELKFWKGAFSSSIQFMYENISVYVRISQLWLLITSHCMNYAN